MGWGGSTILVDHDESCAEELVFGVCSPDSVTVEDGLELLGHVGWFENIDIVAAPW